MADTSGLEYQQYKRLDYDYELISGNVHTVSYEKDSVDMKASLISNIQK